MGPYTQQDPIGIAGGLNLYGYANGDPVNFSDPFGLCADGEAGDTITIRVKVLCPGNREATEEIQAVRADPGVVGQVALMISQLEGGAGEVTPGAVSEAYESVLGAHNVFIYPSRTAEGNPILTNAQTNTWGGVLKGRTPRVSFKAGILDGRYGYYAVGHEGAHLVSILRGLGLSEAQVTAIQWQGR